MSVKDTPLQLHLRRVIYEKFNDLDTRFTNDEIFAILQKERLVNPSMIIDDLESFVNEICDSGLTRNIAQNFTTIWLKLFTPMEKMHCNSCGHDVHMGESEERICPNPSCKSSL